MDTSVLVTLIADTDDMDAVQQSSATRSDLACRCSRDPVTWRTMRFCESFILQRALSVATIMQVIDARDPLTYRSSDLEDYAHSISRHKGSMLLLNKSDLLPEVMVLLTPPFVALPVVWLFSVTTVRSLHTSLARHVASDVPCMFHRLHALHGRTISTARASPTSSGRPSWRRRWQTTKQVLGTTDISAARSHPMF